jgi:PAS domain S-box-containing protein
MIMAESPHLQTENFREFHSLARRVSEKLGFTLVVRDYRLNRQVLNSSQPWGEPLADGIPAPLSKSDADALRAGKAVVSDVFKGPLVNRDVVAVIVPIIRNNELQHSIAAGVPLTHFEAILDTTNLHPDHLATVIDRGGTVVTRSRQHREFAGTRVLIPMPLDTTKVGRSKNREGIPFHWFNRQSALTGWYISVGIPDQVFDAPANRARWAFALSGCALLGIALVFSYRWGGRLAQSSGALGIDRKPTREEFEILFDSAPNGVMVLGADGIIMLANARLENKFGYQRGELIGQQVEQLVPVRSRGKHLEFREMFEGSPEARPMGAGRELFGQRKDGSKFPVEIALNPITTSMGDLALATIVDISARKLAESQLEIAVSERDDLRRRLMHSQEQERLRLAHELHDQTGQTLTAVMLELKSLEPLLQDDGQTTLARLQQKMEGMGRTLHRVAWELRPASLNELGLVDAIENYVSEWSSQYDIESDFFCADDKIDELSDEIRTALYRIVQEGLTNIAKHAQQPSTVSIVIERRNKVLHLMIEDSGCGFEVEALLSPNDIKGLGIPGIRERLALLGGVLEIESSPGKGTIIFARIPL